MTRVYMGKQDIQGYTGYTVLLGYTWVNRIHKGIQHYQGKHGYIGDIGVCNVYSMTRINMGKQGIQYG